MRIEQNHPIGNQLPFIRIWIEGAIKNKCNESILKNKLKKVV